MLCYRNWRQFWLLLWKNWLLQKKKVILTIFLVLFPISLAMIIVLMKHIAEPDEVQLSGKEVNYMYATFSVTPDFTDFGKNKIVFAYAPKTNLVARLVLRAATLMGVNISSGMT